MRFLFLLAIVACLTATEYSSAVADERTDFFEAKIRPVLVEHCYKCHAADAKNVRGGLLLDSKVGSLAGGDSGAAVVPGMPGESLLISSLRHESFEMPPDRKLPEQVIANFEKWITDGAVDPRTGGKTLKRSSIDMNEGRKFWSYQPVKRPEVPASTDNWAKSDIDRFIHARVRAKSVTPADDATAEQVYRRLSFGLAGRPPAAESIIAFVDAWKANPDAAVASAVDEFLSSPHFGERWGRHWLDVVRYAESSGGGRSLMFPDAWRFRDYVFRSFNDDKPFNQLIREHIAGDLLPAADDATHDDQVTGVGYLTLGPTNYELQDKELLRMEVVDEQIDTIGRTFLGMTIGCARCHDHKFDPIPTADYYALAGIFRSTKTLLPGNVSGYVTTSLKTGFDSAAMATWQARNNVLKAQIAQLSPSVPSSNRGAVPPERLQGVVVDDKTAVFEGDWTDSTSILPYVGAGYKHDNHGAKEGHRVRFEVNAPEAGRYYVRFSYGAGTNRCVRVAVEIQHDDGTSTVHVDQRKKPDVDGLFHDLGEYSFVDSQKAVVSIDTARCGAGIVIVDAVQLLPAGAKTETPPADVNKTELAAKLQSLEKQLKKHTAAKPKIPVAMGVRDEDSPADWHIHVRGGIRNLGPITKRGALTVVNPIDDGLQSPFDISEPISGRMQLAEWLASPANPLTTRVFVNRVWQKLIGEGIVRTADNFGKTGQLPSHPELLDHLAATFVEEDNWSVKSLIRRIATSRVYRLSSEAKSVTDPDNRLFSRGIRRRLEAEALRDTMLHISGQLKETVYGGITIHKVTQYDNGYDHDVHSKNLPSVYVPVFRNSTLTFFDVFDVANPNLVVGKRTVSTLPSQALYLLNSPFVLEQSKLAAEHFLRNLPSNSTPADAMIDKAWLQTVGRYPTDEERNALGAFVAKTELNNKEAWTTVFQALFASVDFRYVD